MSDLEDNEHWIDVTPAGSEYEVQYNIRYETWRHRPINSARMQSQWYFPFRVSYAELPWVRGLPSRQPE